MRKQDVTYLCHKTNRRLCRKILGSDRKRQSDNSKQNKNEAHLYDVAPILIADTCINDRRNYQRHKQFQCCLQQFKQRS